MMLAVRSGDGVALVQWSVVALGLGSYRWCRARGVKSIAQKPGSGPIAGTPLRFRDGLL